MKIQSIDKEVLNILETGYYKIPRFQRPYSWDKDNVVDFWEDSITENSSDYFIGSFVVYKNDSIYGVVDGQQRLTTITMLLAALRNFFSKEGFSSQANGIHKLIEKTDLDDNKQFVLQTETSYPYFQEYIQKFGEPEVDETIRDEEKNIKNAYEIITSKIDASIQAIKIDTTIELDIKKELIRKKLEEIRDKILRLKVIYIELDDENDAYVVFETLNTRGKELRPSDLVKNHFTRLIKIRNQGVDLPRDKWNQIRELIEDAPGNITTDTFIHHMWLSKYEYTTLKTLFSKFKEKIKRPNASKFLNDILFDSKLYRYIHEPSFKDWSNHEYELARSMDALNLFRVSQQTPMVLSVLREYELKNLKLKHTAEILQAIEHFHYIFTAVTSQRSSGGIGTMYAKYARELFQANQNDKLGVTRELQGKLRERIPSFDEFKVNFSEIYFTNRMTKQKKLVQYTLTKIDKYIKRQHGDKVNYNLMTIEHILPQNPSASKVDDKIIGQLGNLVFITDTLNEKLGNKPFEQKKQLLSLAHLVVDDILELATGWDTEEIRRRTDYFADLAYNKIFTI